MSAVTDEINTRGLLFDMDGTLLDSTPAVEATWKEYSERQGLDLTEVLRTSHGVRTIDNLRRLSGMTDEQELKTAVDAFESSIAVEAQRLKDRGEDGLILLPGVGELLQQSSTTSKLVKSSLPVWAIVTSATAIYAGKALPTAGVPSPPFLITGDMCTLGKPDPEPYLRGARALGLDPSDCIVVEDAPAGVKSGVAAGCRVLAVCTSHSYAAMNNLGATWIVSDLSRVRASLGEGFVNLSISKN